MRERDEVIEDVAPVAVEPAVVEPALEPVFEYDAPPPQWKAGTVVPLDTLPKDMTDEEYVQWCFDNRMPYWAIKKEILIRNPPVLSSLNPSTAEIGAASFELIISGENFVADSVIVFAGQDEPTTLNEDGTVSTGVNMSYWHGADTVKVSVRNGSQVSEPLDFIFTAAPPPPEADAESIVDDDDTTPRRRRKR